MLNVIKKLLRNIIDDIDAGNSAMDKDEVMEMIDTLKELSDKTQYISKYTAYTKLGISRATFDNLVRDGKLPQGVKRSGFKEKCWNLKDILAYQKSLQQ